MSKVLAVIGARLNSSRLPRKHFLDLAGKPLIERLFHRLEGIAALDVMVLATTDDTYNQPLVNWAADSGRACFAFEGDVNDLVGRVDAVVQQELPDVVLYVCGDSPLVHPPTLVKLIEAAQAEPDAVGAKLGAHAGKAPIHEGFDVYTAHGWRLLVEQATQPFTREHVGSSLRDMKGLRYAQVVDDAVFYQCEHRLSVDTASDYMFMKAIYERWYSEHVASSIVDLTWVLALMEAEPQLVQLNEAVKQRGAREKVLSVLLITECGAKAGLGHLKRMLVLSAGFQDALAAGVNVLVAGGGFHVDGLDLVAHRFVSPLRLLEETQQAIAVEQPDIVVFDVREEVLASEAWRSYLGQKPWDEGFCVAIDGCLPEADMALVPAFHLGDDDPLKSLPNVTYGWPYMLIEPVHTVQLSVEADQVLILSGGSDVDGWGKRLPQLLEAQCSVGTQIHWVRGPFADEPQWADCEQLTWHISQAPHHLYPLMQRAKFAICQYGVSLFECLAHGIPTVAVPHHGFEKLDEVQALESQGLALVAYDLEDAVAKLTRLMRDEALAGALAARAKAHLDGLGGRRAANVIANGIKIKQKKIQ